MPAVDSLAILLLVTERYSIKNSGKSISARRWQAKSLRPHCPMLWES
jgi:hypothetical protein